MTSSSRSLIEVDFKGQGLASVRHQPGKRQFDVALALLMILLLWPAMLIVCLLIKALNGGPILFKQQRLGMGGRMFDCLKFRSMVPNADEALLDYLAKEPGARQEWEQNHKLLRDPRVTRLGQFLRKTSLDELPQLFNVLVGDMSLVGPRPIVAAEVVHYSEKIQLYLAVRPGVTGLWQVSGRSKCSYAERVALDTYYVEKWSFQLDMEILAKTIPAVLSQTGSC
jgi:Undecaprenyl-phosphate galactose phosphotransferase WbaP